MKRANCRNEIICIFCKNWLGKEANTDFITGDSRYSCVNGLCAKDGKNHNSNEQCKYFVRKLMYQ